MSQVIDLLSEEDNSNNDNIFNREIIDITSKKKKYSCNICNIGFGRKGEFINHLRNNHYNLKKFECGLCSKKYGNFFTYDRHISKAHKGDLPFPYFTFPHRCGICKLEFENKNELNEHLNSKIVSNVLSCKNIHRLISRYSFYHWPPKTEEEKKSKKN